MEGLAGCRLAEPHLGQQAGRGAGGSLGESGREGGTGEREIYPGRKLLMSLKKIIAIAGNVELNASSWAPGPRPPVLGKGNLIMVCA